MRRRGFVLLEAMVAVAIFSIGVIALGQCVNNCIIAEGLRKEDALAVRALENRMIEIEGGAVPLTDVAGEILKSPFDGMTLTQTNTPLELKNEKDEDLSKLVSVTLTLAWTRGGVSREKLLTFYVLPRQ